MNDHLLGEGNREEVNNANERRTPPKKNKTAPATPKASDEKDQNIRKSADDAI